MIVIHKLTFDRSILEDVSSQVDDELAKEERELLELQRQHEERYELMCLGNMKFLKSVTSYFF